MHRLSAYVIVHRTQSNQTADGNRLDSERNPIGWRTESDRMADGNTRGCSCLSCTNQANWQSIAAVSAAPTKQTGNLFQLSPLHQPSKLAIYCSCLHCTNQANWQSIAAGSAAPTKPTEQSIAAVSARLCRLPEQELHQPSNKANDTNVGGYGIPAVATQPSTQISFH